jgi:hypothetical protein
MEKMSAGLLEFFWGREVRESGKSLRNFLFATDRALSVDRIRREHFSAIITNHLELL